MYDDESSHASNTVLDAQMKKTPQIYSEELFEKKEENALDGRMDKELNIPNKYNKRALPNNAPTYQLETFDKNALLILNHTHIKGYLPRSGTERDVEALKSTFKEYNFEVDRTEDFTKQEIMAKLKEFSSRDFTDYGCVAVAVLTHGSYDGVLLATDAVGYSEQYIINLLHNIPTLATKPKLLIIQACRGKHNIRGVNVFKPQGMVFAEEEVVPYSLVVEPDMLILHSSYIGRPSHRNKYSGSWFIQILCRHINELASTLDFESILTEVKREIAVEKTNTVRNRSTDQDEDNKQVPTITSTLVRKLYLNRRVSEASVLTRDGTSATTAQLSSNLVVDKTNMQLGPCSCLLEHYSYITKCLQSYLEDNPDEAIAKSLLDVASTFEDGVTFNNSKERMAKAICGYLKKKTNDQPYLKYLYFYKHYE